MVEIFEDIFDEVNALADVDEGTGKQLSQLVRQLRDIEQQIEDTEPRSRSCLSKASRT